MSIQFDTGRWVAVFSQTGSEIATLMKDLGRIPDLILTNQNNTTKINREVFLTGRVRFLEDNFAHTFNPHLKKGDTITLHGYLRIIPADVCGWYNIYNGHPGLITQYPELKGKDPQEKAYRAKMTRIGSVVHRCTELVDEGEVYTVAETSIAPTAQLDDYYNALKETSRQAWLEFFRNKTRIEAERLNQQIIIQNAFQLS